MKINLELNDVRNCYWAGTTADAGATWVTAPSAVTPGALLSASLFVDYIYLDTDERRRFAQISHEYLIEQLLPKEWSWIAYIKHDLLVIDNFNSKIHKLQEHPINIYYNHNYENKYENTVNYRLQ